VKIRVMLFPTCFCTTVLYLFIICEFLFVQFPSAKNKPFLFLSEW